MDIGGPFIFQRFFSAFDLGAITFKAPVQVLINLCLRNLVLTHGTVHHPALTGCTAGTLRCSWRMRTTRHITTTTLRLLLLDKKEVKKVLSSILGRLLGSLPSGPPASWGTVTYVDSMAFKEFLRDVLEDVTLL